MYRKCPLVHSCLCVSCFKEEYEKREGNIRSPSAPFYLTVPSSLASIAQTKGDFCSGFCPLQSPPLVLLWPCPQPLPCKKFADQGTCPFRAQLCPSRLCSGYAGSWNPSRVCVPLFPRLSFQRPAVPEIGQKTAFLGRGRWRR